MWGEGLPNLWKSDNSKYFTKFSLHFLPYYLPYLSKHICIQPTHLKEKRVISGIPLKDHFPPLLPGSDLNPLPVWRRSTELLKLYRSRELVQYVLSSHRHHWDCRVPVSGSAAWNTKKVNSSKCNTNLLRLYHLLNIGRDHLELQKYHGCYKALEQFALLFSL